MAKTEVKTLDEYRIIPDGDAVHVKLTGTPDVVGGLTHSPKAKRTRTPLLSTEVNKAERKLKDFLRKTSVAHHHITAYKMKLDSLAEERADYIAVLPDAVKDSLKNLGLL